jgi:hypothetical protein
VTLTGRAGQVFTVLVDFNDTVVPYDRTLRLLAQHGRLSGASAHVHVAVYEARKLLTPIGQQQMIGTRRGVGNGFHGGDAVVDLHDFRADLREAEKFLESRNFTLAEIAARRATDRWSDYPVIVTPQTRRSLRRAFAIRIEASEATGDESQARTVWEEAHELLRDEDVTKLTQEVEANRAARRSRRTKREG